MVLSADAPLLYTAYEPRPDLLVVDLPGADLSSGFVPPSGAGSLVTSIRFEPVLEMGKQLTRVSLSHQPGVSADVRSVGLGLAISFEPPAETAARTEILPETLAAPAPAPAATIVTEEVSRPVVQPAQPLEARGELAHQLEDLQVSVGSSQEVTVALLGDGVFAPKDFLLENPPRLVIDLPGVKNQVRHRVVAGQERARHARPGVPVPVSSGPGDPRGSRPGSAASALLVSDGERLAVFVRAGDAAEAVSPPIANLLRPVANAYRRASGPCFRRCAAAGDGKKVVRQNETPAVAKPEPEAKAENVARTVVPEPPASAAPPPAAKATASVSPALLDPRAAGGSPQPAPVPRAPVAETAGKLPRAFGKRRRAWRRRARPTPPANGPPLARKPSSRPPPRCSPRRKSARPEQPASTFQPADDRGSTNRSSPGEPISLDLKDADIKDVFRTISQLTQLNIVVDPEVRGTVTVQLEDVPWDQALDLILKQNGLGYVLENNIMRIATTAKLAAEQSDRARLSEARQAAEPTAHGHQEALVREGGRADPGDQERDVAPRRHRGGHADQHPDHPGDPDVPVRRCSS